MDICDANLCSGCGLCVNICPVQAIRMEPDKYFGHKRPVVDAAKCIECKVCQKKCPNNQDADIKPIQRTYAAWLIDDEKHYSSSSGGIASAIYETYLNDGNWIVGVYNDDNFEPQFKLSNDIGDIESFKSSKYVQVCTNDIYNQVLSKLKDGADVAFVGLPCHCAAMKKAAKGYDDKLLLVDLICHGVPSYFVLKSYITHIEKKSGHKADYVKFRNSNGVAMNFADKSGVFYSRNLHEDIYLHSFISGDLFADSCYNCRYACSERVGDITIGDFWKLGENIPFNHQTSRISAVLVNSEKGQGVFDSMKDIVFSEERSSEEAIAGNTQLREPSCKGYNHDTLLKYAIEDCVSVGLEEIYGKFTEANYKKRKRNETLKSYGKKIGLHKVVKLVKK